MLCCAAELPTAFNREAIDKIAAKFCYHNNKANRKRRVSCSWRC